jgi:methionine-S-sulfoxide reductase
MARLPYSYRTGLSQLEAQVMNTRRFSTSILLLAVAGGLFMMSEDSVAQPAAGENVRAADQLNAENSGESKLEKATFGSGCFWCTEAVFEELAGVKSAVSGYSGGHVPDPTYEQVCTGFTGHAEVIQVTFDPKKVSFAELLEVFWQTHDPTTLNRQGPDTGTQYRSAIFYHNDEQRREAEHYKRKLDEAGAFNSPIVTEITKFEKFYPAEEYHQEYYANNPRQGYCQMVVRPKVAKFRKAFKEKLKVNDKDNDK